MKLTARDWLRSAGRVAVCAVTIWLAGMAAAQAQAVSTTTVQGTVYLANGQPAGGTLVMSWPTFTTAAGQLISAGQTTVTVGADGYVSVNLAPNQGATPAGEYYTAVFYKSDGTVSTQYWTVPAAAQASLAQVQAQVMPAAQAVQAVSKAYVDQTVAQAIGSQLSGSGGDLTGPLYLNSDPTQPMQAADKHYVDSSFSAALPLSGGTMTGPANFSAAVTFGSNVTASSAIGFTGTGAAQTLDNLLPGAASDSENGMTLKGTSAPDAMVPKVSPMADIRANGAKIDGATDIGPGLAASMAQCNVANGNSCTVLLPCTGPNGCYWANGTDGVTLASNVTLMLQGNLNLQTTLATGNVSVNLIGSDGGNQGVQFQASNQIASVTVPSADNGVLGTAVTVTPTSGNFGVTQAFTPSTMVGLYANTWITIAGPLTCNISTISRASNVVTATLSGACHIPPGVPVTIAGVTDSTFDGAFSGSPSSTTFLSITSDYVKNTMTWKQGAALDGTGTGGTITGLNEDTIENTQISSCTSTTCTATFYRSHLATDLWGVDGISLDAGANGSKAQLLKSITIRAPGTALDAGGYNSHIEYVSTTSTGQCSSAYYNFPVSIIGSSYLRFDSDAFNGFCEPFSMHIWNQYNYGFAAAGPNYISNTWLLRGVKMDHGASDTYITNSTCDQCYAAISFDPNYYWDGNANFLSIDKMVFNDNTDGFLPVAIYQLYPVATNSPAGFVKGQVSKVYGAISKVVNDYFPQGGANSLKNDTALPYSLTVQRGVVGNYNDGRVREGETRGSNANFSPAVIPYATDNVPAPGSWSGGCTVTTGAIGPDGTANAAGMTQNTSDLETFYTHSGLTPAVGDAVLFGVWAYTPAAGAIATAQGTGKSIFIDNNTSAHYSFNNTPVGGFVSVGGNEAGIINDWWHPVVGIAIVTASDGTSGQTVNLRGSCDTVKTIDYFNPWMMYVPASANIPLAELERWRTQMMHGYVPPSAVAGTSYLNPALKLGFGTAVDLYASGSQLQSDESFQAAGVKSTAGTCAGSTPYMKYDGTCGSGSASGTVAAIAPTTYSGTVGINPTTFYTTPNDGTTHQYSACMNGVVTAAGTAGSAALIVEYTYGGHAFGNTLQSSNMTLATQWSTVQLCGTFLADPNTAVQYRVYVSGATGTPTVGYGFTLTQLQ